MENVFLDKGIKSAACAFGFCLGSGLLLSVPVGADGPSLSPTLQGQEILKNQNLGVHPGMEEKQFEAPATPKSGPVDLQIPEGSRAAEEQFEQIKLQLSQVNLEGAHVFSEQELRNEFASLIGQEVSLAEVYRIAERITTKYRDAGYVLSRAVVPTQKINKADGVVRVVVVEGSIQRVIIEPADATGKDAKEKLARVESRIRRYVDKITESKPLNIKELERYLLLANDVSGVTAKAVLRPDPTTPGAADLILKTEFKTYAASIGVDNMGTRVVGPLEGMVKASLNSPFGYGEHVDLTSVTATPFHQAIDLQYGSASFTLPIGGEGFQLKLDAVASYVVPGDRLALLNFVGKTNTYSVSGIYPVFRGRDTNFFLEGGLKLTRSEVDVLKRPFNDDRLRKLFFKGSYDSSDSWAGVNLLTVQASHGLNFWKATKKGDLLASRTEAAPGFTKVDGEFSRMQGLPYNMSLLAAIMWQYTSQPLFSSEEMGVGGNKYGRGYDLGDIAGDRGIAEKLELQYNKELFTTVTSQFYAFLDHGQVSNLDAVDEGTKKEVEDLISSGVGVRGTYGGKLLNYELFVAKPMAQTPINEPDTRLRWFGKVSVNF